MPKVVLEKSRLDALATAISNKSGEPITMTLDEMVEAVDSIDIEPVLQSKTYTVDSAGTATITADNGYDGLSSVSVSVPSASYEVGRLEEFYTDGNTRKWRHYGVLETTFAGWMNTGEEYSSYQNHNAIPTGTTITPTTSSQTVGGRNYMMEGAVTVNAIPSQYIVPSGTKSITENGTGIDVANYASVDVNVPIGVSNIIEGTFTTPSTEGVGSVTFENPDGYYPIALMIWVEDGVLNPESDWYNAVSQYAIGLYSAVKNVTTSPSDNVYWYMWAIPKASSANTFSMVSTPSASITSGSASSDPLGLVKLLNYNQISYYTKGSSYGFLPDTTYRFVVVYSLL